jgi:hypothetical protein
MKLIKQNTCSKNPGYNKIFGSLLAAVLLMFGTASFAQERENVANSSLEDFNNADLNTNQEWDEEEFNKRMGETYLFDSWDTDKDKQLTKEEFEAGYKTGQEQGFTVKEHVIGNHAIVEVNEDDSVNLAGAANPQLDLDTIDDWDLDNDGYYSEAEMNSGLFDYWDQDNNDALDYHEYSSSFLIDKYRD